MAVALYNYNANLLYKNKIEVNLKLPKTSKLHNHLL